MAMPVGSTTLPSKVLLALLLAVELLCPRHATLLGLSVVAAEAVAETQVPSQPTADEDLYLCYLLPGLYQEAFAANGKSADAEAQAAAQSALLLARTVREHAKNGKVDPRVEKMYADLLEVAERWEKSLLAADRAAGAVNRESIDRGLKKSLGVGALAGLAAAKFHQEYRNYDSQGKSADEALVGLGVGTVAAIGSAIISVHNEIKSANDQAAAVRERELAELKRFCEEVDARQRNTLFELIKERGWKDVEPPGEAQSRRIAAFQKAAATQNPDDQLRVLREALAANPRNYFLHLAVEDALSAKTNRSLSDLIESSKRLAQASRLVPDAAIYDNHRLVALQSSATLCAAALGQEATAAGERWEPNATSKYAVTTLEDLCRRVSRDQLPVWNLLRAYAYLANRQLTDAEALVAGLRENESKLATLVPAWAGTVDCLQAGIQSVKGDPESGLKFLSKAVAAGAPVTKDWWTDADYRGIRKAYPKEFAELLAVKAAWTIEFGVFNDDVIVQNNSGFDLTGVRVKLKGRSGAKEFDVELATERMPRGQIIRWPNSLSIPKDPGIRATLEFTCDQTQGQVVAEFVR